MVNLEKTKSEMEDSMPALKKQYNGNRYVHA